MAYGMMIKAAGKAAKGIKDIMKSPKGNRRDELRMMLKGGNPLERMDDSAKKAFARKNLK